MMVKAAASPFSRPGPLAALIVAAVALDQAIKWAVEAYLPFHQAVPVIPFLSLFRTYNEGVAFSLLAGTSAWMLVAVTLCITGFVLFLWRRTPADRWLAHIGFALVIGGALGNLIDRVLLGHVVDYVLFHTATWSFAVFNLADSFITVGAAAIVLDELLAMRTSSRDGAS